MCVAKNPSVESNCGGNNRYANYALNPYANYILLPRRDTHTKTLKLKKMGKQLYEQTMVRYNFV